MKRANVIGVAGAGAWGMALANAAAAAGRGVVLWGRDAGRMQAFAATRRSDRLPGVDLARVVEATAELDDLAQCDAILVAVPAQSSREAAMRLAALPGSAPLVSCAKGIERGTHAFMTEVLGQAAPGRQPHRSHDAPLCPGRGAAGPHADRHHSGDGALRHRPLGRAGPRKRGRQPRLSRLQL